jgi:hypothetical protein
VIFLEFVCFPTIRAFELGPTTSQVRVRPLAFSLQGNDVSYWQHAETGDTRWADPTAGAYEEEEEAAYEVVDPGNLFSDAQEYQENPGEYAQTSPAPPQQSEQLEQPQPSRPSLSLARDSPGPPFPSPTRSLLTRRVSSPSHFADAAVSLEYGVGAVGTQGIGGASTPPRVVPRAALRLSGGAGGSAAAAVEASGQNGGGYYDENGAWVDTRGGAAGGEQDGAWDWGDDQEGGEENIYQHTEGTLQAADY